MIVPPRPMPGRPDNKVAQNARVHAQAGRASSWARSRPCGARPASSTYVAAAPPLAEAFEASRRASACFRRSVPHRPSWTWLRAALHRPDDGAVAHPAAGCAAAVDSLAPDVAAASEGCAAPLLGLPPSTCGGIGRGALSPRRLREQTLTRWPLWRGSCTRSWPWGSSTSDASKTRMIRDPYSSCL